MISGWIAAWCSEPAKMADEIDPLFLVAVAIVIISLVIGSMIDKFLDRRGY